VFCLSQNVIIILPRGEHHRIDTHLLSRASSFDVAFYDMVSYDVASIIYLTLAVGAAFAASPAAAAAAAAAGDSGSHKIFSPKAAPPPPGYEWMTRFDDDDDDDEGRAAGAGGAEEEGEEEVWPVRCCPPRPQTRFEPSPLELNGIP